MLFHPGGEEAAVDGVVVYDEGLGDEDFLDGGGGGRNVQCLLLLWVLGFWRRHLFEGAGGFGAHGEWRVEA